MLRRFLGGVGLGAWLLAHETTAGVDPLGPEAALVFALSPLVGSPLTTSAKFAVVAFSPLTGRVCDALSSSHFAIAAKRAGVDALVVTGACDVPSVVLIDGLDRDEPSVQWVPADSLWGLPAREAEDQIRAQHGSEWQVAAIGPAGERLIPFATLSHDGRHAGRAGWVPSWARSGSRPSRCGATIERRPPTRNGRSRWRNITPACRLGRRPRNTESWGPLPTC